MGSSPVEFAGREFEANDAAIAVWLYLLVEEIDRIEGSPEWLHEIREAWHIQSIGDPGIGIWPSLDRFVSNDERRLFILRLCEQAMARLRKYGEFAPKADLNAMGTEDGAQFEQDVPIEFFKRTGHYFTKLLQGTLREDENNAHFYG